MDSLLQDIKFGLRSLIKRLEVTGIAALALGLGIGAVTAIFSVVNGVLLQPLPFDSPELIVTISEPSEARKVSSTSPANYLDWKSEADCFEELAGYRSHNLNMTGGESPERIRGFSVSPGFFGVFGVTASQGRTFLPGEEGESATAVAVLSHGLWQRRFGADRSIIGEEIILNDRSHAVIGVMPEDFDFPSGAELWVRSYQGGVPEPPFSLGENLLNVRGLGYFQVVGRLKEQSTLQQADAQIGMIAHRLREEYPDSNCNDSAGVTSIREVLLGDVRPALIVLMVAVVFVLLIACANIANLLLAKAMGRELEIAVRGALGADRRRLLQQLLTESMLLALLGGLMGMLLSKWGVDMLVNLGPGDIPRLVDINVDATALLFCLGAAVITGILFGILPALFVSRTDLQSTLREGGSRLSEGRRRRRVRELLVSGEIALAMVLLLCAVLMIESLGRLRNVDPGFNPEGVAVARVQLPEIRYPEEYQMSEFFNQVVERVRALPGVESAGAVMALPLSGSAATLSFTIEGRPEPEPGEEEACGYQPVTDGYLETMMIPVIKGRSFTLLDDENAPAVVIINDALARKYYPDEDPVGKRVTFGDPEDDGWLTIVGVVGNVRHFQLEEAALPKAYIPFKQDPWPMMTLVARTSGDLTQLQSAIGREVMAVDSDQPVYSIGSMGEMLEGQLDQDRFLMYILSIFAVAAAFLAAVGIYGVVSFSVTQRTHEIGIRIALGARRLAVLELVVKQGMLPAAAGIGIGFGGAIWASGLLRSILFEVSTGDMASLIKVTLLVTVISLFSVFLPAVRATNVEPVEALKYE